MVLLHSADLQGAWLSQSPTSRNGGPQSCTAVVSWAPRNHYVFDHTHCGVSLTAYLSTAAAARGAAEVRCAGCPQIRYMFDSTSQGSVSLTGNVAPDQSGYSSIDGFLPHADAMMPMPGHERRPRSKHEQLTVWEQRLHTL